jgi:hypothetical protein
MSYRLQTYWGFVVGAATAAIVSLALGAVDSDDEHEEVLRVERIEVLDAEGNVRMTLGGGRERREFGMTVFGREGWMQLYLGGWNAKGGMIHLSETQRGHGDGALSIGANPRDTGIYARTGKHKLSMSTGSYGSVLTLDRGRQGVGLGVFYDGGGGVFLRRNQDEKDFVARLKDPGEEDGIEGKAGGAR